MKLLNEFVLFTGEIILLKHRLVNIKWGYLVYCRNNIQLYLKFLAMSYEGSIPIKILKHS